MCWPWKLRAWAAPRCMPAAGASGAATRRGRLKKAELQAAYSAYLFLDVGGLHDTGIAGLLALHKAPQLSRAATAAQRALLQHLGTHFVGLQHLVEFAVQPLYHGG